MCSAFSRKSADRVLMELFRTVMDSFPDFVELAPFKEEQQL
jgi:hypothetical protein